MNWDRRERACKACLFSCVGPSFVVVGDVLMSAVASSEAPWYVLSESPTLALHDVLMQSWKHEAASFTYDMVLGNRVSGFEGTDEAVTVSSQRLTILCADLVVLGTEDICITKHHVEKFLGRWKKLSKANREKFLELHEARAAKIRKVGASSRYPVTY